jgi:hypothetical protein
MGIDIKGAATVEDQDSAAEDQPPAADVQLPERHTFSLPSGKTAAILKQPKGWHMRMAGRAGQAHPNDGVWQNYCLVAETTLINGQAVTAEDVDQMPLGDVNELVGKLQEISQGKFPASGPLPR